MNNIDIIINTKSINMSKRKIITGEVCFQIGEQYFPELGWNDFILKLHRWWIQGILDIIEGKIKIEKEFNFMDGPYFIKTEKIDRKLIFCEFIEQRLKGDILCFSEIYEIKQLVTTLSKSSSELLKYIGRMNWSSSEINDLKILNKELKNKKMI